MRLFLVIFILPIATYAESFPDIGGDLKTELASSKGEKSSVNKLDIGGELKMPFEYYALDGEGDGTFRNPSELTLYMDGRGKNDVRAFLSGKYIYDPTLDESKVDPLTGENYEQESFNLEEMKLMFNMKRRLFVTVGKQKIKWGAGKFWNPTDFLNQTTKDPLDDQDDRSGISLVKGHIPFGNSNLYLIGKIDESDEAKKIAPAGRIEIPIKTSEISLSFQKAKDEKMKYGTDLSFALWMFDLYGEVAFVHDQFDSSNKAINFTTGASIEVGYSDNDTATFSVEYFRKDDGYSNTPNYLTLYAQNLYNPFNVCRDYGMFSIYLPKPYSLNEYTFFIYNLTNLVDRSSVAKIKADIDSLQDLIFSPTFAYHYGRDDGELKFGGQKFDVALEMSMKF